MLNWRSDFGLAGYFEKDTLEELIQLEFSEGFCSNPDCGSFEKLSCTSVPKEFLESEYTELPHFLQGSPLLPPFSMAFVKGWKRSVALLTGLCGVMELALETEISHATKATWLDDLMLLFLMSMRWFHMN